MRHFLRCNWPVDDDDPVQPERRSDFGKGIGQAGALSGNVVDKATICLIRIETGHYARLESRR
jgi:hypothetical protein